MKLFAWFVFSLAHLVIGVICLFWPKRVQTYALRWASQGPLARLNPFLGWMRTPGYIVSLRICGAYALSMFVLTLVVIFKALT